MPDETIPENLSTDQDLNLAAIVHSNIAASKEAIRIFEESLVETDEYGDTIDVFSTPREVIEGLLALLKTNVKMVTEMFEENSMFHEQADQWQRLRDGLKKTGPTPDPKGGGSW